MMDFISQLLWKKEKIMITRAFSYFIEASFFQSCISLTLYENRNTEKNVEKRENTGSQHFLLFPHCFSNLP